MTEFAVNTIIEPEPLITSSYPTNCKYWMACYARGQCFTGVDCPVLNNSNREPEVNALLAKDAGGCVAAVCELSEAYGPY